MKRTVLFPMVFIISAVLLASCLSGSEFMLGSPTVTGGSTQTVARVQAEPWRGPKAVVAVMEFDNKTGAFLEASRNSTEVQVVTPGRRSSGALTVRDPIGNGMKEQLVTALSQTGAFILIERQYVGDILAEQELAKTGQVKKETAVQSGELESPQFLIYGAVTEYKPSQASAGVGAGYGALPILSDPSASPGSIFIQILRQIAAAGFVEQDHVAIDFRLVDARTGRIVNATSVEARPRDLGGAFGGMFGEFLVGSAGQYQTPMQKAIRAAMIKAANWIGQNTLGQTSQVQAPAPEKEY